MYSPDAILRCSEGIRRGAEVDPTEFASTHGEIVREGLHALPHFGHPTLLSRSDDTRSAEAVCWFEVTELRQQQRLKAAVGIRTNDAQTRIGWTTLAAQVRDWSYADGYLHSLADYAWMRGSEPARPRALIDASYFRQYWRPQTTFTTLADARFVCQMTAQIVE